MSALEEIAAMYEKMLLDPKLSKDSHKEILKALASNNEAIETINYEKENEQ